MCKQIPIEMEDLLSVVKWIGGSKYKQTSVQE